MFNLEAVVQFTHATIEKPQRFAFNSVKLRPSWFIYADAQEFGFHNVDWYGLQEGTKRKLECEAKVLREKRDIRNPYPLLRKIYRELYTNYETKRDYPVANEFHYWSMEALRKEDWKRFGLVATSYWALSGYGVRPLRALVVLIIMSLVFAVLYSVPTIGADHSLQAFADSESGLLGYVSYFLRTEMYSLGVLARLNPEPKPTPGLFQTLAIVEGIVGPLQIALLALAVRRKVMR